MVTSCLVSEYELCLRVYTHSIAGHRSYVIGVYILLFQFTL